MLSILEYAKQVEDANGLTFKQIPVLARNDVSNRFLHYLILCGSSEISSILTKAREMPVTASEFIPPTNHILIPFREVGHPSKLQRFVLYHEISHALTHQYFPLPTFFKNLGDFFVNKAVWEGIAELFAINTEKCLIQKGKITEGESYALEVEEKHADRFYSSLSLKIELENALDCNDRIAVSKMLSSSGFVYCIGFNFVNAFWNLFPQLSNLEKIGLLVERPPSVEDLFNCSSYF